MEQLTEDEIKFIASQLRKPSGKEGLEVGQKMNEGNKAMNLHSLAVLDPQAGDSILEVGMGIGKFVKNILELSNEIKYTGCDYSPEMVDASKSMNQDYIDSDQAKFHCSEAVKMPFPDETFTKVLTINTFYFWDDNVKVLNEISRVLKKDGRLILSVRPKENMQKLSVTKYNFTMLSNDEICELLFSNGFKINGITKIEEPDQVMQGFASERKCVIFDAVKE